LRRCAAARRPLIFDVGIGQRLPFAVADDEAGAVHRAAPDAAIAFNTRQEDSADAAVRWLKALYGQQLAYV
jgi:hypothetical protein